MAQVRKFDEGSVFYFRGNNPDYVYRLLEGQVQEEYQEGLIQFSERVGAGGFFGVKEMVGGVARLGSARALTAGRVEVYGTEEFLTVLQGSADLLEKELQREVNFLHKMNDLAKGFMGAGEECTRSPDNVFFAMGEFYEQAGRARIAQYVFKRFVELYPQAPRTAAAKDKIAGLDTAVVQEGLREASPEEMLTRAEQQIIATDYTGAIDTYKALMMRDVSPAALASTLLGIARAYLQVGKALMALRSLKRFDPAAATRNEVQEARFLEGNCHEALEDIPKAIASYRNCDAGEWEEKAAIRIHELGGKS